MDQDSREQYRHFLLQSRVNTRLIEFREAGKLRMVSHRRRAAATGCLRSTRSSNPTVDGASFGTYNILWQIEQCRSLGLPYLYLGYWISKQPQNGLQEPSSARSRD